MICGKILHSNLIQIFSNFYLLNARVMQKFNKYFIDLMEKIIRNGMTFATLLTKYTYIWILEKFNSKKNDKKIIQLNINNCFICYNFT